MTPNDATYALTHMYSCTYAHMCWAIFYTKKPIIVSKKVSVTGNVKRDYVSQLFGRWREVHLYTFTRKQFVL